MSTADTCITARCVYAATLTLKGRINKKKKKNSAKHPPCVFVRARWAFVSIFTSIKLAAELAFSFPLRFIRAQMKARAASQWEVGWGPGRMPRQTGSRLREDGHGGLKRSVGTPAGALHGARWPSSAEGPTPQRTICLTVSSLK